MKKLLIYHVCMIYLVNFHGSFCCASLKPNDLFSLMQASQHRYLSIDAVLERQGFHIQEEKTENPTLMYAQEMTYRRSNGITYVEAVTKTFPKTGSSQHFKEITLLTPEGKKYFREDPIGNKQRYGEIQDNQELTGWIDLTPEVVFWHSLHNPIIAARFFSILRENTSRAAVTFDEASQQYLLNILVWEKEKSPSYQYTIDPTKEFMATVEEFFQADKSLAMKSVCRDYRQVSGFWAPFRYSVYLPNGNLATDVTIKSLSINQLITPEKLAFEFPEGTHVTDRLLGVNYTVREKETDPNRQPPVGPSGAEPGVLAPPATDAELAQSALKAQELIAQEKQAAGTTPTVSALEVVPSYVWVLPGKNDYTLSVKSEGDKTPVLISHLFENGGLILHALEDQFSTAGQIRITLERPESLTGYADGVLTLTFSDQTVKVHFIAAPIIP